jgi:hypothetical protein
LELTGPQKKYCSLACGQKAYRRNKKANNPKINHHCVVCKEPLSLASKAKLYCSPICKSAAFGHSYGWQQARGLKRKRALIESKGGQCIHCGYAKNLAGLVFHHRDETTKEFSLDVRTLSVRSILSIELEVEKCDLLCANCHAEHHHPHLDIAGLVAIDAED